MKTIQANRWPVIAQHFDFNLCVIRLRSALSSFHGPVTLSIYLYSLLMYEDATLRMQKHMTIHLLSNSNRPLGHSETK